MGTSTLPCDLDLVDLPPNYPVGHEHSERKRKMKVESTRSRSRIDILFEIGAANDFVLSFRMMARRWVMNTYHMSYIRTYTYADKSETTATLILFDWEPRKMSKITVALDHLRIKESESTS